MSAKVPYIFEHGSVHTHTQPHLPCPNNQPIAIGLRICVIVDPMGSVDIMHYHAAGTNQLVVPDLCTNNFPFSIFTMFHGQLADC